MPVTFTAALLGALRRPPERIHFEDSTGVAVALVFER
jgi:hypothetical protein